jgi:hypothetical protein
LRQAQLFPVFGKYCEAFDAIYNRNPPRFDAYLVPPTEAICDPKITDSEVFNMGSDARFSVHFNVHPNENFSRNAPSPQPRQVQTTSQQ